MSAGHLATRTFARVALPTRSPAPSPLARPAGEPRSATRALAALAWVACVCAAGCLVDRNPPPPAPRYYSVPRTEVLRASIDILRSEGFRLGDVMPEASLIVGESRELVRRTRGGFIANTEVRTRVILELDELSAGTDVRASFEITFLPPGGQARTWVSATPPCEKLRREFYRDLDREIGSAPVSAGRGA